MPTSTEEPIVSSPIEKRYPIGTELELIARSDGWAKIRNPISKHTGWVLERHYLEPAKSASSQMANVEPEDQVNPSTKPRRKATAEYKRKVEPRSRELAESNFSFGWGLRKPRWSDQGENDGKADLTGAVSEHFFLVHHNNSSTTPPCYDTAFQ